MGLFDEVAGGLLKMFWAGKLDKAACWNHYGLLKSSESGGLQDLQRLLMRRTWRGNVFLDRQRRKPSISPEQIQQVLGSGQVQQIAENWVLTG
jgi:uncharacterized protein YidB (DUF937 family)